MADRLAAHLQSLNRSVEGGLAPIQRMTLDAYQAWKEHGGPAEVPDAPGDTSIDDVDPDDATGDDVPSGGGLPGDTAADHQGLLAGWFAVRCVFHHRALSLFEERITLWPAALGAEAIDRAVAGAAEYAEMIDGEFLGFAEAYAVEENLVEGAEVFSLLRESDLDPTAYISSFFDTGRERLDATIELPGGEMEVSVIRTRRKRK